MQLVDLLGTAASNLRRHKLRTILTVAGVAIGTTTLAVMLSVAAGLQLFAIEQTQAMMANDLVTISSNPDVGSIRINVGQIGAPAQEIKDKEAQTTRVKPVSVEQIAKLRALPHVSALYANIQVRAQSINLLGGVRSYEVVVSPAYPGSRTTSLVAGSGFSGDQREVILAHQYLTVFGWSTPDAAIGQTVLITVARPVPRKPGELLAFGVPQRMEKEQFRARVVGITARTTDGKKALIPYGYALEMTRWQMRDSRIYSSNNFGYTGILRVDSPQNVDAVAQAVRAMGMGALTPADQLGMINTVFIYIQGVLSLLGLIAIAVASLGISNTLVMAIYERTREIGIWKALGATKVTIRLLFTVEAGAIGFGGGAIGVALAWVIGQGINAFARETFAKELSAFELSAFPPWLVLAVIGFGTLVGVLAGLLPANRAAGLDPVQALRHE